MDTEPFTFDRLSETRVADFVAEIVADCVTDFLYFVGVEIVWCNTSFTVL